MKKDLFAFEKIERLLNVRPGEWAELLFFLTFNTFLCTGLSIGESVSEALFLKRVGVEFLPYMFIVCALVAIPLSLAFSNLQTRISGIQLSIGLGVGSILAVLMSLGLIHFQLPIGYPVLFIVQNALSTILATHFSILLGGHFKTLDAKRLVPLILSGNVLGAMFGGLILHKYSQSLGVENLLLIWVGLLVSSLAWFLVFCIHIFPSNWILGDPDPAPKYAAGGWFSRWMYEGKAVLGSPLLVLLAFSTLLMTLSKYFIEFQYSDIFSQAFVTESDLARFFGFYTLVSNLVALVFQSFVTGRLIQWAGVSNANLFYPGATFLAFSGVALSYSVAAGIFARFDQEGFRKSVYSPVTSLLYNAIPAKQRARSITFNEGIMVPLGTVLAGVLLLLLRGSPTWVNVVAILFSGAWLGVTWWQRGVYSRSLLDLLKRSRLESINQDDRGLGALDAQTQVLVIDSLKDSQDEVVELAADLLMKYGRSNARLALLREASIARNSVKVLLISKIAHFPGHDVKKFLLKSLADPDEMVRLSAIEALVNYPQDEEIRMHVGGFLESPDPRFQAVSAAAVVRGGDLVQMMKALLILQKLLFSKDPAEAALGIKTLGKTRDERFWVNLRPYLANQQDKLRLEAMRSMNAMIRAGEVQDHLEILGLLLKDQVREIRSLSIQILGRVRTQQSTSLLIEALGDTSPRNRRLAIESLSEFGSEIVPDLLMILDDPHASVCSQEGAVKLLSLSQDPHVRERLSRFGLERIRNIYEMKVDELTIRTEIVSEDGAFLAQVLAEKAQALLKLVLVLLAPDPNQSEARMVVKNLYSKNQEVMSNAIEVLQSLGERTLIYHILPVLEVLPLEQIAAYGRRVFNLENRSSRLVLGRYLLALDKDLKEASIYTIGRLGMKELVPAIKKIREGEGKEGPLIEITEWALEHISKATIFSERAPVAQP